MSNFDINLFNEKLMPAFRESTREAFETMAMTSIEIGAAIPKQKGQPEGAISGTIGISGSVQATAAPICGNVSLIFEKNTVERIFKAMTGMGSDETVNADELKDVVGELANMVAGGAKSKTQGNGVDFNISLPTVVVGEKHHLEMPSNTKSFVVPLKANSDTFFLELSFS